MDIEVLMTELFEIGKQGVGALGTAWLVKEYGDQLPAFMGQGKPAHGLTFAVGGVLLAGFVPPALAEVGEGITLYGVIKTFEALAGESYF